MASTTFTPRSSADYVRDFAAACPGTEMKFFECGCDATITAMECECVLVTRVAPVDGSGAQFDSHSTVEYPCAKCSSVFKWIAHYENNNGSAWVMKMHGLDGIVFRHRYIKYRFDRDPDMLRFHSENFQHQYSETGFMATEVPEPTIYGEHLNFLRYLTHERTENGRYPEYPREYTFAGTAKRIEDWTDTDADDLTNDSTNDSTKQCQT